MNKKKKTILEKNGWKVGNIDEFLGLSPEEERFIEFKVALAQYLQEKRKKKDITQHQLAEMIKSSQSRVAKIEKADDSVSIDLIIRSLLAIGVTNRDIAKAIV